MTNALILDTSALLAYFNSTEPLHEAVAAVVEQDTDALLVVSPYVIAELDYLLAARVSVAAELAVLAELASGAWELAELSPLDLANAARIVERYADQQVGVTDASLVVLADRYDTRRVVTLDRRHFDVLRATDGGVLEVLPSV